MKNYPIGIFDSGIGGLTVANAIKKVLPNENIIYFGDTEHLPYGEKSAAAIQNYSAKIIKFLITKKCKMIIVACNSASSVAWENIKRVSNKTPILNVIDPIIKKIETNYSKCNIGVIGTKATIESKIYEIKIKNISPNINVRSLSTPLLAPMIEEGFINEKISNTVITNYLSEKTLKDISHLILACTHYPLIQNEIIKHYKSSVKVIDSPYIIAEYVFKKLEKNKLLNDQKKTEHYFYVSNYTKSFEKSAKFFFKETIKLEEVNLFR